MFSAIVNIDGILDLTFPIEAFHISYKLEWLTLDVSHRDRSRSAASSQMSSDSSDFLTGGGCLPTTSVQDDEKDLFISCMQRSKSHAA